jgi:hypothetical protein
MKIYAATVGGAKEKGKTETHFTTKTEVPRPTLEC